MGVHQEHPVAPDPYSEILTEGLQPRSVFNLGATG
jgi:hypothetical protein